MVKNSDEKIQMAEPEHDIRSSSYNNLTSRTNKTKLPR